jgi:hypothetical protein
MPPANPAIYASGGTALLGTFTLTLNGAPVPAGLESDELEFELWNSKGDDTADELTGASINFLTRDPGDPTADPPIPPGPWSQASRTARERWIQIRATGVVGNATPYTSNPTPMGRLRPFRVPNIAPNSARTLSMKLVVPGGAASEALEILLAVDYERPAIALAGGLYEAGGQGIVSGLGDGLSTYIAQGGAVTPTGTPDEFVTVADIVGVLAGEPYAILEHQEEVTGDASDGALASGQAYWAELAKDTAGAGIVQTKGTKGTAPRSLDARPEKSIGRHLAYVHRDFDAAIAAEDIYESGRGYGLFALTGAGLTRTLHPGVALVDDSLIRLETERSVTFPASTDPVRLWLLPSGDLEVAENRSDPRALLLWSGVTDGTTFTSLKDERQILGQRTVRFRMTGGLAVNDADYASWPLATDGYLALPVAVLLTLDDVGAGTGGRTALDIEYWNGAAWTTLFTSSGTEDRRPALAYNATVLQDAAAIPEVRKIGRFTRLRARCVEVPSGGAAPTGAEMLLFYRIAS